MSLGVTGGVKGVVEIVRKVVGRGYLIVPSEYCLGCTILFCERVAIGCERDGGGSDDKAAVDGGGTEDDAGVDDGVGETRGEDKVDAAEEDDEDVGDVILLCDG